MSWIKNTGSKYHTQDTNYYCGAACAMVVLSEIGVSYASLDQDDLYNDNHSHNVKSGWATDPVGLNWTMVHRKPASFTNTFVVYKKSSEAEGSQKIVYTLMHYGVSPIVLVYGCMHWIVVTGVQTNVNPSTGPYVIEGFWVNNSVHRDNEPHAAGDVCGTGGVNGIENQWISYASWKSTYFTGCNYDSADGSKQFISVCDPEEPRISLPRQVEIIRHFDGRVIASERKIQGVLKKEFERYSFAEMKQTSRVALGRIGKPLLVKRLDTEGSFYYLVPSMEKTKVIGFSQVDALFGNIESIFSLKNPVTQFETNVSRIEKKLSGSRLDLPGEIGRVLLKEGAFKLERSLVWKPCRESYSPHLPFWRITIGGHTFYKRIDGPVFAELTVNGRGI